MSIHDVITEHLKVDYFGQQLFCGCGFRLWHPGTGFGDPSTVQQDHQTVAEAALAWHLTKKVQEHLASEAPDVAELRRLAEACPMPYNDPDTFSEWYEFGDLTVRNHPIPPIDAAYIAAASPAVVLALLDDADALLDRLAHMAEARDNARAEVERLTAMVEAVREVHSAASPEMPYCVGCDAESDVFNTDWPCPAIRILDGVES